MHPQWLNNKKENLCFGQLKNKLKNSIIQSTKYFWIDGERKPCKVAKQIGRSFIWFSSWKSHIPILTPLCLELCFMMVLVDGWPLQIIELSLSRPGRVWTSLVCTYDTYYTICWILWKIHQIQPSPQLLKTYSPSNLVSTSSHENERCLGNNNPSKSCFNSHLWLAG